MTVLTITILGLVFGSFLSMALSRLEITELSQQSPKRRAKTRQRELKQAMLGRSRCDHCHKPIAWYDNLPLVSWVVLRARCRHCGKHISHYHPVLEAASALYLVGAYLAFGLTSEFVVAGAFGLVMLLLFAFDLKHQIIPNAIVVPAIVLALALLVVQFGVYLETGTNPLSLIVADPSDNLIGGLAVGSFFLALSLVSRGSWIGGGDIKLGFLIGLLLGWPYALVALVLAYLIGTLYALILLLSRQAGLKSYLPFGPMLVMAFFISLHYGPQIIDWYRGIVI